MAVQQWEPNQESRCSLRKWGVTDCSASPTKKVLNNFHPIEDLLFLSLIVAMVQFLVIVSRMLAAVTASIIFSILQNSNVITVIILSTTAIYRLWIQQHTITTVHYNLVKSQQPKAHGSRHLLYNQSQAVSL